MTLCVSAPTADTDGRNKQLRTVDTVRGSFFVHKIFLDILRSINYNLFIGTQKVRCNMSPKTGRPKSEHPKNVDVKVRFDELTHEKLLAYCEEHNITRTEALRQGVQLLLTEKK